MRCHARGKVLRKFAEVGMDGEVLHGFARLCILQAYWEECVCITRREEGRIHPESTR